MAVNPISVPPAATPGAGAVDALRPVLPVVEGQVLAARVVANDDGRIELALAGSRLTAASDLPLEPGQTARMVVHQVSEGRVALQLVAPGDAGDVHGAQAQANARPAGLAPQTAQALFGTLSQMGMTEIDGDAPQAALQRADMAARAAKAGVSTPAQAAAFARLVATGLPATPAAVAGMATLAEGPPLGRMLAIITGPAPSPATAPTPAPPAAAPPPASSPAPTPAAPAPPPASGAPGPAAPTPAAPPAPPAPATPAAPAAPAAPATTQAAAAGAAPAVSQAAIPEGEPAPAAARTPAAPSAPAAPATATPTPAGSATRPADPLLAQLTRAVGDVADAAVSGDHTRLREAVSRLGHGLEARLAAGAPPAEPDVRTLLAQLAQAPDTGVHTRAMAERAVDALAAQPLAGQTLNPDPSQQSAYLQMPLPGGQTAEVHINADREAEGRQGGTGTRVAFVLNLSRLGPVLIEAAITPDGVDAAVRSASPAVREYLVGQTPDLAEGLARAVPDATRPRVRVDALARHEAPAIIPPPPATGLSVSA